MRTAAVADFLQELRAHGSADLTNLCATLNDGSLVRETLDLWTRQGWIVVARSTPLQALAGPSFSRDLPLERFCAAGAAAGSPDGSEERAEAPPAKRS